MALKLTQRQKPTKQIPSKSKLPSHVKQKQVASDPWAFLETVDAPQWLDLSLETRCTRNDSADSWFREIHEHHVMSLAGLNRSTSWLSPGQSRLDKQSKKPIVSKEGKGYHVLTTDPKKTQNVRHFNMSGHSARVKDVQTRKTTSHSTSKHRTTSTYLSSSVHDGSVDTLTTVSGSGSTCEYEPGKSSREFRLGSDLDSATSTSQALSVSSKSLLCIRRGNLRRVEDPSGTPKHFANGSLRGRSSSSASNSTFLSKSIYLESGSSGCTTFRSYENGVAVVEDAPNLDVSQPACRDDLEISEESVSVVSCISQEPIICARKQGVSLNQQGFGKLDGTVDCDKLSKTISVGFPGFHQSAKETVEHGLKSGRQRFVVPKPAKIRVLPRKQLHSGKENAPPNRSLTAVKTAVKPVQVKDRLHATKTPFTSASSKTANAMCDADEEITGKGMYASKTSKGAGCVQAATFEGGVSYPLKVRTCARQGIKAGAKHVPVSSCTSKETRECERDLAALVAQHNQKLWTLKQLGHLKGLR